VSYSYEWLQSGSPSGLTGPTLAASETARGQTWSVRATPSDGLADGLMSEASITISNSPPTVDSITIDPSAPTTQSTLTCSYTLSDADGDSVSESIAWFIDGQLQSSISSELPGPFSYGVEAACQVTAEDGTDTGEMAEAVVTIGNSTPIIHDISISPSPAYTDDTLTAIADVEDPDGDSLGITFEWSVDGAVVQTSTGSTNSDTLDGVIHFSRDETVVLRVEASDGSSSVESTSSPLTVSNSAPIAFNALVTPSNPVAGADDLLCSAQTGDADNDSVSLGYSWTVDGASVPSTSDTIPASEIADAEIWTCTLTPDDGSLTGPTVSASVTVGAAAEGSEGGEFCAAPGTAGNSSLELTSCLSPASVGLGTSENATYTLQQGPSYRFTPEDPQ
jgi:hypothetical protein